MIIVHKVLFGATASEQSLPHADAAHFVCAGCERRASCTVQGELLDPDHQPQRPALACATRQARIMRRRISQCRFLGGLSVAHLCEDQDPLGSISHGIGGANGHSG